jgi:hypothetical protein
MAKGQPIKPAPGSGRKVVDGADRGGYPKDQTTRNYSGASHGGIWTNSNGTEVGRSNTEDSHVTKGKSTGDRQPLDTRYHDRYRQIKNIPYDPHYDPKNTQVQATPGAQFHNRRGK